MRKLGFVAITLWVYGIISYIVNAVQFFTCDFDAPYKEEIIHAVGLFIPPLNMITCWF